jgi:peptide-methionine (S)-S-oxide reductase
VLFGSRAKSTLVSHEEALPGREHRPYAVPARHAVLGTPLEGPWPEGTEVLYVAMGCFWGAERVFWQVPGVVTTAVGYQGGHTPNPTYEETCTARTGHTEAVLVAYDPAKVTAEELLRLFWESHDPTQGFRQGNDVGTQYRSAVYWTTTGSVRPTRRPARRSSRCSPATGSARSPPRHGPPRTPARSTTPRTTTSSTCTRSRTATAASAAPAYA